MTPGTTPFPATSAPVLAIDIGGTSTKLALVSPSGQLQGWTSIPTAPPLDHFRAHLLHHLHQLRSLTPSAPLAISASVAGFLSPHGTLVYNPNLPWLEEVSLRDLLADPAGLPIHFTTDSNAAALGEFFFGGGQGSRRFLLVAGGTGLGVGMLVDGSPLETAFGGLGDAGHLIVRPGGPLCSCGGHGCAEALLSTSTLAALYTTAAGEPRTFPQLILDAHNHLPAATTLLAEAGYSLGIALASLAHVFFPDCIRIAGGLSAAGDALLLPARASFLAHVGTLPARLATLSLAHTGPHAPLLGAAAVAFAHPSPESPPASDAP